MKILGVIPARSGSKAIKLKNIKVFNNKPLIYWTIKSAKKSKLSKLIVSTDSKKIKKISEYYGCEVPFLRPKNISGDKTKGIEVIQHALNFYEKKKMEKFDAVMTLQPTCPFRITEDINKAIQIMKTKRADSVISLVDVEGFHPARMKYIVKGKIKNPTFAKNDNIPRQKLKKTYLRSGLIYLVKTKLIKKNILLSNKTYPLITPINRSFNIDTQLDFDIAEIYMKKNFKKKKIS